MSFYLDLWIDTTQLHVTPSQTALSQETLGRRVKRDQLKRWLRCHLFQHLRYPKRCQILEAYRGEEKRERVRRDRKSTCES